MERLDKIIGAQTEYSRKDVKKIVLQKRVTVNGELVYRSDIKIDEKDINNITCRFFYDNIISNFYTKLFRKVI